MNAITVVFAKEVRDNLRDRRSLLSALIYPLLGPLVFGVLLHVLAGVATTQSAAAMPLLVSGAAEAPELMGFLQSRAFRIRPAWDNAEGLVKAGKAPVALEIPARFEADLAAGGRAALRVVNDNARLDGLAAGSRLIAALQDYADAKTAGRLTAMGIDPASVTPVTIETLVVTRQLQAAEILLTMIPAFLMFTLFIGGVYLAIDSISGERERGSLEPLLCHPVPRWQFLAGKSLAAGLFSGLALILQLAAFHLVIGREAALLGPDSHLGVGRILGFLPLLLPMLALAVAVQMLVAILTRSYKEAQTWLGLLPLVPALPSMALALLPGQVPGWVSAVPLLSQTVAMQAMVLGRPAPLSQMMLGASVTLAAAALLFAAAARRMESEALIFGGT